MTTIAELDDMTTKDARRCDFNGEVSGTDKRWNRPKG